MATILKTKGTALVTGAAKRIGKAICLSLSALGYTLAIHYNQSSKEAEKLSREIQKRKGQCHLFRCDLSDEHKTAKLIQQVRKACPNLNILVNNASLYEQSALKNPRFALHNKTFAVNFHAPYILTSQFAKECKQGHIINILDTHIVNHATQHASYLLSKKALYELTKLSALELAPAIRVNAVAPGLILPPEHSKSGHLKRLAKNIPLKQKGHVDHITKSIEFLIHNTFLTGQVIYNDGGEHLL